MDQSDGAIVDLLQSAGQELRAAEDQINQLETEINRVEDRAVRAETWLQLAQQEIAETLCVPKT